MDVLVSLMEQLSYFLRNQLLMESVTLIENINTPSMPRLSVMIIEESYAFTHDGLDLVETQQSSKKQLYSSIPKAFSQKANIYLLILHILLTPSTILWCLPTRQIAKGGTMMLLTPV